MAQKNKRIAQYRVTSPQSFAIETLDGVRMVNYGEILSLRTKVALHFLRIGKLAEI